MHWSWLAAFFLIYLAIYQFFQANLESTLPIYAALSLGVTLAFFLSVVLHELAHSLVARRKGVPVRDITLFVFGGIARMGWEVDSPSAELRMAAAGPLFSLTFFLFCAGLALLCGWRGWEAATLSFTILAMVNFGLTFFNLLPGFPLDGGRILRAFLWKRWEDPTRSTIVASRVGQAIGILLMGAGVVSFFFDLFQSGYDAAVTALWMFFIGFFLLQLASLSCRQSLAQLRLYAVKVSRLMRPSELATGNPDETSGEIPGPMVPSSDKDFLNGGIIPEEATLIQALRKMEREGRTFLEVSREGKTVGLVFEEDIRGFLHQKDE